AKLDAIPGCGDDDSLPGSACGSSTQSSLTRTFAPGTYFMAASTFDLANDQVASGADANVGGNLTDFPDSVVDASTTTNVDVSFAVVDSAGTTTVAATKPGSYDVLWFTFFVGNPNPGTVFCEPGVSGVMACVCGNPNGPGRGCANTGGAGATIGGAGDASLGADTLTLTGTSMFSGTS